MATLLHPSEVQQALRISPSTLHRMRRRGELIGLEIGGTWKIYDDELQAYLRQQRKKAEQFATANKGA